MVVYLARFHQVVTGLIPVFTVPPVASGKVVEDGVIWIEFLAFVQKFLTLCPAVLGEVI